MNAQEIRDLFQRHKVTLSRDDVWEVHPGTPVVKHSPLERLAAAIGVEWGPPQILRAERDEAVLIATGKIGDGQPEWSIGEAVIGQNYKVSGKMAAYPYAMAEKRAKDRVILKLAGLHGAYSEEEADDFKQGAKPEEPPSTFVTKGFNTDVTPEQFGARAAAQDWESPQALQELAQPGIVEAVAAGQSRSKQIYITKAIKRMVDFSSASDLLNWAKNERLKVWPQYGIEPHDEDGQRLVAAYRHRMEQFREEAA